MENTDFLKLKKPDELDYYAINDFNANMDTIDLAVEKLEEMSAELVSSGSPRYFLSTQNNLLEYYDADDFIGRSEIELPITPGKDVETLLAKFAGVTYVQTKQLLAGVATGAFYIWSDFVDVFTIKVKLYKLRADGTEYWIADKSVDVSNRNPNVPTSITMDIVNPVSLEINERIIVKLFVQSSVVGQVINFAFGGTNRPSRIVLPMSLAHNDLDALQGGIASERYHLTRDQHDKNLLNDGDASNVTNFFTEATSRGPLSSGEKLNTSLGKMKKWYTDLRPVAWSGNASDLTEDASNRLVTDSEKSTWNGKLNTTGDASNVTTTFTQSASRANLVTGEKQSVIHGKLMKWYADLKPVAWSGNASDLTEDASNRLVTDSEKSTWNGKLNTTGDASNVTTEFTQSTSRANLTSGEKLSVSLGKLMKWYADLKPVAWSGNASDLTEDASNRLVTDSEKSNWNGKLNTTGDASNVTTVFTQGTSRANLVTGEKQSIIHGKLMKWYADLRPVAWSGNASDLTEDANNRFVTDSEKSTWNGKLNQSGGTMTGDLKIQKNNAWMIVDSPSSGENGVEQAAGVSIGEAADTKSTALHLTYTGDGCGHIGMGLVGSTTGVPQYEAIRLNYMNGDVLLPNGTLKVGGSGNVTVRDQADKSLRVSNSNGYIEIAPKNTSGSHIYTDLPTFYMNKPLNMLNQKVTSVANGSASTDAVNKGQLDELVPSGTSMEWNSNTVPSGYLWEDGQAVSRTTYSALFSKIGTTFGAGDGSTTFNLPNSKGRVSAHYDSAQADFNTLGKLGGKVSHALSTSELPVHDHSISSHYHSFSDTTSSNGSHSHSIGTDYDGGGGSNYGTVHKDSSGADAYTGYTNSTGNHTHTVSGNTNTVTPTIGSEGSGSSHKLLQPYIVKRRIIKY